MRALPEPNWDSLAKKIRGEYLAMTWFECPRCGGPALIRATGDNARDPGEISLCCHACWVPTPYGKGRAALAAAMRRPRINVKVDRLFRVGLAGNAA